MFEAIQKKMKEGCWRFKAAWPELKEEWVDVWRRLVVLAVKIGRLSIKALCLSGKMIGVFFQNESVSNAEEKKEVAVMETMDDSFGIKIESAFEGEIKDVLKAIHKRCLDDIERIQGRVKKIVQDDSLPDQWPHDGVKRSSYDRSKQTILLHPELTHEHVTGVLAHWLGRSILHPRKGRIKIVKGNMFIEPVSEKEPEKCFWRKCKDRETFKEGELVEYEVKENSFCGVKVDFETKKATFSKKGKREFYADIKAGDVKETPDCRIEENRTAWSGSMFFVAPSQVENQILGDYYACSRWDRSDCVQGAREKQFLEPSKRPGDEWEEPHWGFDKKVVLKSNEPPHYKLERQEAWMVAYKITDNWGIRCCGSNSECCKPVKFPKDKESIQRLKFGNPELLRPHLDKHCATDEHVEAMVKLCTELPGYGECTKTEFKANREQLYIARAKMAIQLARWTFISASDKDTKKYGHELKEYRPFKRSYCDDQATKCIIHSDYQVISSFHSYQNKQYGKDPRVMKKNKGRLEDRPTSQPFHDYLIDKIDEKKISDLEPIE